MAALAEIAQDRGLLLAHENEKDIYGDIPERCADLVDAVGSPALRATFDAANFVQCGVAPHTRAYPLIRPHLVYLQVKDALAATGEVVPAGQGDGQVRETLAAWPARASKATSRWNRTWPSPAATAASAGPTGSRGPLQRSRRCWPSFPCRGGNRRAAQFPLRMVPLPRMLLWFPLMLVFGEPCSPLTHLTRLLLPDTVRVPTFWMMT